MQGRYPSYLDTNHLDFQEYGSLNNFDLDMHVIIGDPNKILAPMMGEYADYSCQSAYINGVKPHGHFQATYGTAQHCSAL